jgi:hypothetical protein
VHVLLLHSAAGPSWIGAAGTADAACCVCCFVLSLWLCQMVCPLLPLLLPLIRETPAQTYIDGVDTSKLQMSSQHHSVEHTSASSNGDVGMLCIALTGQQLWRQILLQLRLASVASQTVIQDLEALQSLIASIVSLLC